MPKDQHKINQASHQGHVNHWANEKKKSGQWLSKADYQKKTGRPGKSKTV